MRLGKWLVVLTAATAVLGVCAGLASAASGFKLSITPAHLKPGGTVTISTTPRAACMLKVTIAKVAFSHAMKDGWTQVKMPAKAAPGRVPVTVTCAGHSVSGSFTVSN